MTGAQTTGAKKTGATLLPREAEPMTSPAWGTATLGLQGSAQTSGNLTAYMVQISARKRFQLARIAMVAQGPLSVCTLLLTTSSLGRTKPSMHRRIAAKPHKSIALEQSSGGAASKENITRVRHRNDNRLQSGRNCCRQKTWRYNHNWQNNRLRDRRICRRRRDKDRPRDR
jgi:hypothetical protein